MKNIILISFLFLPHLLFAQKEFSKEGILRAQGTLSTGAMYRGAVSPIYLHGDLEYYLDEKVSIKGDTYYMLGSLDGNHFFQNSISSFAGLSWHFLNKKMIDPYATFQPGAALITYSPFVLYDNSFVNEHSTVNPLISFSAGFNYYASKFFHLFMNARYIQGTYIGFPESTSLNELRFSFGLGWNLRLKKMKEN